MPFWEGDGEVLLHEGDGAQSGAHRGRQPEPQVDLSAQEPGLDLVASEELRGEQLSGEAFDEERGEPPQGRWGDGSDPEGSCASGEVVETGSEGFLVIEEALALGLDARAQTRSRSRAERLLPPGTAIIEGDPKDQEFLRSALAGVDLVVFTLGGDRGVEGVFYSSTLALLLTLQERPGTRLAFMTSMSISRSTDDSWTWKRRAERLVRASGVPYTIVRPGWFDYQGPTDSRIDLRQGDLRSGTPGVDRRHIARVLLEGALVPSGAGRTVEVFSGPGEPIIDFDELFAATARDTESGKGALDRDLVPLSSEPTRLRADLARLEAARRAR